MIEENKQKRILPIKIAKILGTILALGFILIGLFINKIAPHIGFGHANSTLEHIKYAFIAIGLMDLAIFLTIFK